ncbi:hypothetical protein [Vibrio sp. TRT 17S01]|uniref:hypothetical protein n=1 Tax=Vibrio sp. TRT 17S01 TaxID=3418505 RepID=UPI003CFA5E4C
MTTLTSGIALFTSTSVSAVALCNVNEQTYFSCELENGYKVAICAKGNSSPGSGYVQWRMTRGTESQQLIPEELSEPKYRVKVNHYSEKIYNFISLTFSNEEILYSAYMGDYGEEHWMEGITIGDLQLSCKTPVKSDYVSGEYTNSLQQGALPLSAYPFEAMIEAALKTKFD